MSLLRGAEEKIRILHVLPSIGFGGVEERRCLLAEKLDKQRYEQKIFCLDITNPKLAENIRRHKTEIIPQELSPHVFHAKAFFSILRLIWEWKPRIIHGAVFEGMVIGAAGALFAGPAKLILEETSDLEHGKRSWRARYFLQLLAKRAVVYVAVAKTIGDYLERCQKIPRKKIRIIHNGMTPPPMMNKEETMLNRQKLGIPVDAFVVGTVGRLKNEHKRITDIIEAMHILKKKEETLPFHLLVFGKGPDEFLIKELAEKKGVSDRVCFLGHVDDKKHIYSLIDVFVLASAHEACSIALIEAMLAGRPIVATRVGGNCELIEDGVSGVLIPPHAPHEIAFQVGRLYRNNTLRESLAARAQAESLRRFSAEVYVNKVQALYEEVLHAK